ncbi:hypothetical protein FGO68_gene4131 [Halteria grandinella]|uniref:intramembrane prenyl-peptidase Rce1 n=1 Tax=Halteria grandinella TaxID=5974 RepID=A0A8J8T912_HALGN|nr:hypothetical protein FGO68_gene4131 [Halteria grandinella]
MRETDYYEFSLLNFKNLFLAPFFEEFIYRVVIINIFLEADVMSVNKCVLICPLFFAIAHIHQLWRDRNLPKELFKRKAIGKLFQLCFTQVFGIYAGYVYAYTGEFWAIVALHAQCNFFGFPQIQNCFDENFTLARRLIIGYIYLIGIVLYYNSFSFFMNPTVFQPWFLSLANQGQSDILIPPLSGATDL